MRDQEAAQITCAASYPFLHPTLTAILLRVGDLVALAHPCHQIVAHRLQDVGKLGEPPFLMARRTPRQSHEPRRFGPRKAAQTHAGRGAQLGERRSSGIRVRPKPAATSRDSVDSEVAPMLIRALPLPRPHTASA